MAAYSFRLRLATACMAFGMLCLCWPVVTLLCHGAFLTSMYASLLGLSFALLTWYECAFPVSPSGRLLVCFASRLKPAAVLETAPSVFALVLSLLNSLLAVSLMLMLRRLDFNLLITALFFATTAALLGFRIRLIGLRVHSHLVKRRKASKTDPKHVYVSCESPSCLVDTPKRRLHETPAAKVVAASAVVLFRTLHTALLFGVTLSLICSVKVVSERYPRANMHSVRMPHHQPRSVFLRCDGWRAANDTVLFASDWARLGVMALPFLSRQRPASRVCVFDRFGYGWSSGQDSNWLRHAGYSSLHDSEAIDRLLDQGALSGSLVYVGHGFGGLLADCFAARHPERLRAVVHLDLTAFALSDPLGTEQGAAEVAAVHRLRFLVALGWRKLPWLVTPVVLPLSGRSNLTEVEPKAMWEVTDTFLADGTVAMADKEADHWRRLGLNGFCMGAPASGTLADQLALRARSVPHLVLDRNATFVATVTAEARWRGLGRRLMAKTLTPWNSTDDLVYTMAGAAEIAKHVKDFLATLPAV